MAISSSNYAGVVCAFIVWMGIAATAAADSAPSSDTSLTEIIVTATRRSERLQDVPMSIMALSGTAARVEGRCRADGRDRQSGCGDCAPAGQSQPHPDLRYGNGRRRSYFVVSDLLAPNRQVPV
jgi:hypothetical protein